MHPAEALKCPSLSSMQRALGSIWVSKSGFETVDLPDSLTRTLRAEDLTDARSSPTDGLPRLMKYGHQLVCLYDR